MEKPRLPLIAKSFRTPKDCHIRRIELGGGEAEIGYDCGDGGRSTFPLPRGEGFGTYPSMIVKGVRTIKLPGAHVSGPHAVLGFELIPRHVKCQKKRGETTITCQVHTSSGVISGSRRQRRRGAR